MPEQKKTRHKREMAQTHAMVVAKPGFRVNKGVAVDARLKVTSHLKELETMGFVLFVPCVGWVDSTPAVRRYSEKLGIATLISRSASTGR
jgi:hypothetical protein